MPPRSPRFRVAALLGLALLSPGPARAQQSFFTGQVSGSRFARIQGAPLQRLRTPNPALRAAAALSLGRGVELSRDQLRQLLSRLHDETHPAAQRALLVALARQPLGPLELLLELGAGHDFSPLRLTPDAQLTLARILLERAPRENLAQLFATSRGAAGRLSLARARATFLDDDALVWLLAHLPESLFQGLLRSELGLGALGSGGTTGGLAASASIAHGAQFMLRAITLRGDPRLGAWLASQLSHGTEEQRLAALDAVVRLRLLEAGQEVANTHDAEPVEPAGSRTVSRGELRRRSLRALAELGYASAYDRIAADLREPSLRADALEAIGLTGDRRFVGAVREVLVDAHAWPPERRAAALVLARLGGETAEETLRNAARSPGDEGLLAAVYTALARLGGPRSLELLAARAVQEPAARWALVEAKLRGLASCPSSSALEAPVRAAEPSALALSAACGLHEAALLSHLVGAPAASLAAATGLSFAPTLSASALQALRTVLDPSSRSTLEARAAAALCMARAPAELRLELTGVLLASTAGAADAPTLLLASLLRRGDSAPLREPLERLLVAANPLERTLGAQALAALGDVGAQGALRARVRAEEEPAALGAAALALGELGRQRFTTELFEAWLRCPGPTQDATFARALHVAESGGAPLEARGNDVLRVEGARPGSLWAASDASGALRFAVATSDGTVLLAGLEEGIVDLRPVELR